MTKRIDVIWSEALPAWLYGLSAVLCCAVLFVVWLSAASLLPIDETRYAGVAWEMLRSGNLLVPHSNGAPYPDKPPLLFWLLSGGWALFGPSIWWARLVPVLFALASLGLTSWLARCLWLDRPRTERLAPAILLGFVLWAVWTPLVLFDVLLTFWVLLAIAGVAVAGMRGRRVGWVLVALGTGLGILSKGPVAVLHVLPVALLAPLWLPRPPRWPAWYGRLALALVAGALVALAWAVPAALAGGEGYAHAILWGQSAGRMAHSFAHARPWWWYLSYLPLLLAPWIFWPTAWRSLARLHPGSSTGVRFVLCWIVPVFVAFSLISGKQIHYLLPLLPAAALLLARALDISDTGRTSALAATPITLLYLIVAGAVVLAPWLRGVFGWPAWSAALPGVLPGALVLAGVLPLVCGRGKERRVLAIAVSSVLFVAALVGFGLPVTAPRYDLRRASDIVAQAQNRGTPVAHVGGYDDRFQFLGRLSRPVRVVDGGRRALAWARTHPDGLLVVYFDDKPQLPAAGHAEYRQPFRGGWLAIVRAGDAARHPERFFQ